MNYFGRYFYYCLVTILCCKCGNFWKISVSQRHARWSKGKLLLLLQCHNFVTQMWQLCPCFLAKHQFGIHNSRLWFVYKSGVSSGTIKSGVVWPICVSASAWSPSYTRHLALALLLYFCYTWKFSYTVHLCLTEITVLCRSSRQVPRVRGA